MSYSSVHFVSAISFPHNFIRRFRVADRLEAFLVQRFSRNARKLEALGTPTLFGALQQANIGEVKRVEILGLLIAVQGFHRLRLPDYGMNFPSRWNTWEKKFCDVFFGYAQLWTY